MGLSLVVMHQQAGVGLKRADVRYVSSPPGSSSTSTIVPRHSQHAADLAAKGPKEGKSRGKESLSPSPDAKISSDRPKFPAPTAMHRSPTS